MKDSAVIDDVVVTRAQATARLAVAQGRKDEAVFQTQRIKADCQIIEISKACCEKHLLYAGLESYFREGFTPEIAQRALDVMNALDVPKLGSVVLYQGKAALVASTDIPGYGVRLKRASGFDVLVPAAAAATLTVFYRE